MLTDTWGSYHIHFPIEETEIHRVSKLPKVTQLISDIFESWLMNRGPTRFCTSPNLCLTYIGPSWNFILWASIVPPFYLEKNRNISVVWSGGFKTLSTNSSILLPQEVELNFPSLFCGRTEQLASDRIKQKWLCITLELGNQKGQWLVNLCWLICLLDHLFWGNKFPCHERRPMRLAVNQNVGLLPKVS